MIPTNIQQLLDNPDVTGAVRLPCGEFEGPFIISRPCVVVGNNTTLWSKNGPILNINSNGVALKDIRVEVTDTTQNRNVCIAVNATDTRFSDVEIIGEVSGIPSEQDEWYIPKIINLGKFPAERNNTFTMQVYVPAKVSIVCNIYDLKLSATELYPGKNTITITTDKLKNGSYIYGELLFVSKFSRRIYITGSADDTITSFNDGGTVYNADTDKQLRSNTGYRYQNNAPVTQNTVYTQQPRQTTQNQPAPQVQISRPASPNTIRRGERVSVNETFKSDIVEIQMNYDSLRTSMDIDPYVFLLNKNNIADQNNKLVFFGNIQSGNGEVQYITENGKGIIRVDLSKVASDVEKIAVSYSIYGDNPNNNFSKVVNPTIAITSSNGIRKDFCPDGLMMETTIVAIEFYRHNNIWKLSAIGNGYRNGLKRLCESFGLNVS